MFKLADMKKFTVKTQPTITFSNGMVLWLGEKDQDFSLTDYDLKLLYYADKYIRNIKGLK